MTLSSAGAGENQEAAIFVPQPRPDLTPLENDQRQRFSATNLARDLNMALNA